MNEWNKVLSNTSTPAPSTTTPSSSYPWWAFYIRSNYSQHATKTTQDIHSCEVLKEKLINSPPSSSYSFKGFTWSTGRGCWYLHEKRKIKILQPTNIIKKNSINLNGGSPTNPANTPLRVQRSLPSSHFTWSQYIHIQWMNIMEQMFNYYQIPQNYSKR